MPPGRSARRDATPLRATHPFAFIHPGIVSNPGSALSLHDQDVREPWKIRPWGSSPGSTSSEPIGIMTMPEPGAERGTRAPHALQNAFVNRWASGTLKWCTSASPASQVRVPATNRLVAWPVPVALRQREQWQ